MTRRVFAFFADVVAMPDAKVDREISDGCHVYCYVGAVNEREAIERLTLDLSQHGWRLVNVQWCVDQDSFQRDEGAEPAAAQSERDARGGRIVYEPVDMPPSRVSRG